MRKQGRELRRALKIAPTGRSKPDLSDDTIERLEEKARRGKIVARFLESEGWDVIEDVILSEGKVESLIAESLKEGGEDFKQIAQSAIRFGVVTRIINKLHLVAEIGEAADLAVRKQGTVKEAEPTKKVRPQSEQRGKGSPR